MMTLWYISRPFGNSSFQSMFVNWMVLFRHVANCVKDTTQKLDRSIKHWLGILFFFAILRSSSTIQLPVRAMSIQSIWRLFSWSILVSLGFLSYFSLLSFFLLERAVFFFIACTFSYSKTLLKFPVQINVISRCLFFFFCFDIYDQEDWKQIKRSLLEHYPVASRGWVQKTRRFPNNTLLAVRLCN
jgi:hypothetical protein